MNKSNDRIILNNGVSMPRLGLGTWQMGEGAETVATLIEAFKYGYRLVDTAAVYGNETSVGLAIKSCGLPREEIFVTTKIWNSDQGPNTAKAYEKSLERLGLDYADLYLIHWPTPAADKYLETWKILETLYAQKRIRAIGVSNFKRHQLEKLLEKTQIIPAVNQIEIHPYFQDRDAIAYCKQHGIQVESYSPLGGGGSSLLEENVIQEIAGKHSVSPAQAVLRWHLQNDWVVIPKASRKEHFEANIAIFDFRLDEADMNKIAALEAGKRRGPNPDFFNSGIKTGLVQLAHRFGLVHWGKEK